MAQFYPFIQPCTHVLSALKGSLRAADALPYHIVLKPKRPSTRTAQLEAPEATLRTQCPPQMCPCTRPSRPATHASPCSTRECRRPPSRGTDAARHHAGEQ